MKASKGSIVCCLLVVALGGGLSGCGDDDDDGAAGTSATGGTGSGGTGDTGGTGSGGTGDTGGSGAGGTSATGGTGTTGGTGGDVECGSDGPLSAGCTSCIQAAVSDCGELCVTLLDCVSDKCSAATSSEDRTACVTSCCIDEATAAVGGPGGRETLGAAQMAQATGCAAMCSGDGEDAGD